LVFDTISYVTVPDSFVVVPVVYMIVPDSYITVPVAYVIERIQKFSTMVSNRSRVPFEKVEEVIQYARIATMEKGQRTELDYLKKYLPSEGHYDQMEGSQTSNVTMSKYLASNSVPQFGGGSSSSSCSSSCSSDEDSDSYDEEILVSALEDEGSSSSDSSAEMNTMPPIEESEREESGSSSDEDVSNEYADMIFKKKIETKRHRRLS
jgi:hypothetical protein